MFTMEWTRWYLSNNGATGSREKNEGHLTVWTLQDFKGKTLRLQARLVGTNQGIEKIGKVNTKGGFFLGALTAGMEGLWEIRFEVLAETPQAEPQAEPQPSSIDRVLAAANEIRAEGFDEGYTIGHSAGLAQGRREGFRHAATLTEEHAENLRRHDLV